MVREVVQHSLHSAEIIALLLLGSICGCESFYIVPHGLGGRVGRPELTVELQCAARVGWTRDRVLRECGAPDGYEGEAKQCWAYSEDRVVLPKDEDHAYVLLCMSSKEHDAAVTRISVRDESPDDAIERHPKDQIVPKCELRRGWHARELLESCGQPIGFEGSQRQCWVYYLRDVRPENHRGTQSFMVACLRDDAAGEPLVALIYASNKIPHDLHRGRLRVVQEP